MANLPLVEKLLCERYNVRSLDGPLKEAIDAGDVDGLGELIAARDMYRWSKDIQAALKAPSETPVSRMNKRDLVATATEREVEVAPDATVADLREALTAPGPVEEPEPLEEPTDSRTRKK